MPGGAEGRRELAHGRVGHSVSRCVGLGSEVASASVSQQPGSGQYLRLHVDGDLGRYIVFFDGSGVSVYDSGQGRTIHRAAWDS